MVSLWLLLLQLLLLQMLLYINKMQIVITVALSLSLSLSLSPPWYNHHGWQHIKKLKKRIVLTSSSRRQHWWGSRRQPPLSQPHHLPLHCSVLLPLPSRKQTCYQPTNQHHAVKHTCNTRLIKYHNTQSMLYKPGRAENRHVTNQSTNKHHAVKVHTQH